MYNQGENSPRNIFLINRNAGKLSVSPSFHSLLLVQQKTSINSQLQNFIKLVCAKNLCRTLENIVGQQGVPDVMEYPDFINCSISPDLGIVNSASL